MSEPADNLVPCESCGTLIEGTRVHRLVGGFSTVCLHTRCIECEYREHFRTSRLVRGKPYRDPFPRPTRDGRMPADLRAELVKQYAKQREQER